jgi:hypothetical protein
MALQDMLAYLKNLNIGSIVELTAAEGLMSTKDNLPSWMYQALYESNSVRLAWKNHQQARTRTTVKLSLSTDEVFVKPGEAIKIFHHVGVLDLNNFNVHVVTRVTQQTRAQTPKGAQIRWVDITTVPPSGLQGGPHDMEPQFQIIKPDGDDGPVAMGMNIRIEKQLTDPLVKSTISQMVNLKKVNIKANRSGGVQNVP